jgi:hypothetical protein
MNNELTGDALKSQLRPVQGNSGKLAETEAAPPAKPPKSWEARFSHTLLHPPEKVLIGFVHTL